MKPALLTGTLIAVICAAVYLFRFSAVEHLQFKLTDGIMAVAGDPAPTGKILIVDIDEKTLSAHGRWPWPRDRLAVLLNRIARMGARSIALDFIMAEPDGMVSKMIEFQLPDGFKIEYDTLTEPGFLSNNDTILSETLSHGPFVLGYKFLFEGNSNTDHGCSSHRLQLVRVGKPSELANPPFLFRADGIVCNLETFSKSVSFSGFLNGRIDSDGRLRRLPLLIQFNGEIYPSLALAALLSGAEGVTPTLHQRKDGQVYLTWADHAVPMDDHGNLLIRFPRERSGFPRVSADLILKGEANTADFKDRTVFVGLTASGLTPDYITPSRSTFSAVEVHAQATETMIAKSFSRRPELMIVVEVCLAILIGLLHGYGSVRLGGKATASAVLISLIGLWGGSAILYQSRGIVFSPLLPGSVILFNGIVLLLVAYRIRNREARKGLGEALVVIRNSERELSSILNAIPDIVFRLDQSGRITFISPAITKYRKQPEELIGRHMLEFVAAEDRDLATYRINERRTGSRSTRDLEVRLLFSPAKEVNSDVERFFSVSAEGIYDLGKPDSTTFLGTQGIARDIEQRKRLEHQLEQSKKMEAMGSLAAGVAHDLNNILGSLIGYPELLLLELPKDSPMRGPLENIRRSGQRAAAIVQDMLTIARRGVQNRDIISLNDTITVYTNSPEFLALKERYPAIGFVVELSNDLMNIKGSSVHLLKAVMNLVNNAAEAMPAGGSIGILTRNRYLDTEVIGYERIPEGDYVRLSITDEGVGISEEDLSRIFEPFYSKKKMERSGSGLGMTVVWNTVKDHGGYVDIRSREGEGTRFDLFFPATREEKKRADRQVVLQDFVGTESILVVDDIPDQLTIAVKMLGKLGYQVASASGGEEAVAYMRTHTVDLLVLDMVMPPGIDGLETFRRIREIHPQQKAIIASGYAESERVNEMQAMGAGVYIRKPYTLEKIGLAVRNELDRN